MRSPEEYWAGHVPGSRSAPGGQLVQETDHIVGVRGARIALIDDDGTRANMTASWLAQMGWEVYVVDGLKPADFREVGEEKIPRPVVVEAGTITPKALSEWLTDGAVQILDLTSWANYQRGHIPGASWILRKDVVDHVSTLPSSHTVVLTCGSSLLARYAWADLPQVGERRFVVLAGGTQAWNDAGLPLETGEGTRLSPTIDRYRRPYEGTDNAREAMQGYLDWEFGLVEQLKKDGTHGFFVI
nr:rhodanese-like domain-containing protein [Salinicola peritrichatus]